MIPSLCSILNKRWHFKKALVNPNFSRKVAMTKSRTRAQLVHSSIQQNALHSNPNNGAAPVNGLLAVHSWQAVSKSCLVSACHLHCASNRKQWRVMKILTVIASLSLLGPAAIYAKDWLYFTGPTYTNASTETGWNASWSDDGPKMAWKAQLGKGASSFTVKGNRVLTSGNVKDQDIVWCLDLSSGDVIWKTAFDCKFEKRMFDGGTAATPTIDGDRVYNLSYDGQLHCLSLKDGKILWKKHLMEDFGGKLSSWKYATSPLVLGDLVILDVGGNGNSTLALNKTTGAKVWGNGNENAGYATPVPITHRGKPAVVLFKGKHLVAHDLKSGKRLWSLDWETSYDVNASSPVPLPNNQLLVSSGYGGGRAVLLDISGNTPKQLWRNDDIKTKMSSCVVHDGHVFAVCGDSGGKLFCVSLKSGKTVWEQKGFGFGTLTLVGDKLLAQSDKGNLVVAKATSEGYQSISQAQILGNTCWVRPVLAHGYILSRNNKGNTVCLDVRS